VCEVAKWQSIFITSYDRQKTKGPTVISRFVLLAAPQSAWPPQMGSFFRIPKRPPRATPYNQA